MKKATRGFTLIELLVVIGILASIFLVGLPKMTFLFNIKERQERNKFINDIKYIREISIKENNHMEIILEISKNRYTIYNGKDILKEVDFIHGNTFLGNNLNNKIKFNSMGVPYRAGTIMLRDRKDKIIEITISVATGKVNIK